MSLRNFAETFTNNFERSDTDLNIVIICS